MLNYGPGGRRLRCGLRRHGDARCSEDESRLKHLRASRRPSRRPSRWAADSLPSEASLGNIVFCLDRVHLISQ